jgi:hypothetical protein
LEEYEKANRAVNNYLTEQYISLPIVEIDTVYAAKKELGIWPMTVSVYLANLQELILR